MDISTLQAKINDTITKFKEITQLLDRAADELRSKDIEIQKLKTDVRNREDRIAILERRLRR